MQQTTHLYLIQVFRAEKTTGRIDGIKKGVGEVHNACRCGHDSSATDSKQQDWKRWGITSYLTSSTVHDRSTRIRTTMNPRRQRRPAVRYVPPANQRRSPTYYHQTASCPN
jgi:hypothetical protein